MCPDWTGEEAGGSHSDFDGAVEAYRQALTSFVNGDPRSVTELYSRRTTSRSQIRSALRAVDRRKSTRR
jgi:hypothetical protein